MKCTLWAKWCSGNAFHICWISIELFVALTKDFRSFLGFSQNIDNGLKSSCLSSPLRTWTGCSFLSMQINYAARKMTLKPIDKVCPASTDWWIGILLGPGVLASNKTAAHSNQFLSFCLYLFPNFLLPWHNFKNRSQQLSFLISRPTPNIPCFDVNTLNNIRGFKQSLQL